MNINSKNKDNYLYYKNNYRNEKINNGGFFILEMKNLSIVIYKKE